MNAAYKWYSHNSNIIQFYSGGSSSSRSVRKHDVDSVKETIENTYEYAANVVNNQYDINTY